MLHSAAEDVDVSIAKFGDHCPRFRALDMTAGFLALVPELEDLFKPGARRVSHH